MDNTQINKLVAKASFKIITNHGKGNCLFEPILNALDINPENYLVLRNLCCAKEK